LVAAARRAGVERIVAQSIAFDYAPGPLPNREEDTLAGRLENASASSVGVIGLEDQIAASTIPFIILRYGRLYGPGTGSDRPWGAAPVHVEAAAYAGSLAARSEATGVFNIAESDGEVDSTRAETVLGWTPSTSGRAASALIKQGAETC
jgi:nucleoside-diphosphate-sugar epimerase